MKAIPHAAPLALPELRLLEGPGRLLPGLLLCAATALAALVLERLEVRLFGRAWIEALVLAILVGAGVRAAIGRRAEAEAGVAFCARTLLEAAVALLGASVSAAALASIGPGLILGALLLVAVSIPVSFAIGRLLRLPPKMALLIACGNSICGNSAIAAVAPTIRAEGEEVCAAISFTAVLGVAVVLILPALGAALGLTAPAFGALAGLTVYAVPQVLAAAASGGPAAIQVGALVKLVRVLCLAPVVFGLSLFGPRLLKEERGPRPPLRQLLPWFLLAFGALLALRSAGVLPEPLVRAGSAVGSAFTLLAMAALGLSADLGAVRRAGAAASLTVTLSLLALGAMALGLVGLLQIR